jgi:hypothetical protein
VHPLIEEGDRLLAEQAAADQREQLEADALAQIVQSIPMILHTLELHSQLLRQIGIDVSAPRIRHPVRDETGGIISVVDEIVRE